jgi:hypothetical protein
MTEPRRHAASSRNRRKALHHANCLMDELVFLHSDHIKRMTSLQYAIGRITRLVNRLEAEVAADATDH